MLWVKAFHIIFMVMWFSGLFYLPRLFVYHAMATDSISLARFKVMEAKLYYYITTPGAILTLFFGIWLINYNPMGYLQAPWMHVKLACVALLVLYHVYLGALLRSFAKDQNKHNHVFYRWLNELPTILLFVVIIMVTVKPFS